MKREYPVGKSDLFAAFIERCGNLTLGGGASALITMQSWMFLSSYEKLRTSLLTNLRITSMLHLGARAFDSIGGEVVSSTAFVLANSELGSESNRAGTFIRLVEGTSEAEKLAALRTALASRTSDADFHLASAADFQAVPGHPIVYWLSEKMRAAFGTGRPLGEVSAPLVGLRTGDNTRFMRQWWEVSRCRSAFDCDSLQAAAATGARWFPYNKGGGFRRWYGNHEFVVNWEQDGKEIEEGLAERYPYLIPAGKSVVRGQGRDRYFSPSVSWSDISSGAPSFRRFPRGFIHGNKGNSLFGSPELASFLLGVMNAPCATVLLEALAPTMTASVGDVAKMPITDVLKRPSTPVIEVLVSTSKTDWDEAEASWNFRSNPLVTAARVPCPEMS